MLKKGYFRIEWKDDYCSGFVYCFIFLPLQRDADASVHHLVTALLSVQNSCYNFIAFKDFLAHETLNRALET